MNNSTDPADSHIEAALEATCEALMTLELIRASAADDAALRNELRRTARCMRRAIAELRVASGEPDTALSYGFVLAEPPVRFRAIRGGDQSNPLRTA